MIQFLAIVLAFAFFYFLFKPKIKRQKPPPIRIFSIGKDLYLSTHASQRISQRGVKIRELIEMLESKKSRAEIQKNGRVRITNGKITAIVGINGEDLVLVTAFRNSETRN